MIAKVLGATNATFPRQQTNETVAAQPLKVYAAHAKQRGLLAPQQKGLFAAHVGAKLFLTNKDLNLGIRLGGADAFLCEVLIPK